MYVFHREVRSSQPCACYMIATSSTTCTPRHLPHARHAIHRMLATSSTACSPRHPPHARHVIHYVLATSSTACSPRHPPHARKPPFCELNAVVRRGEHDWVGPHARWRRGGHPLRRRRRRSQRRDPWRRSRGWRVRRSFGRRRRGARGTVRAGARVEGERVKRARGRDLLAAAEAVSRPHRREVSNAARAGWMTCRS